MKKLLVALIGLILVLAGCGSSSDDPNTSEATSSDGDVVLQFAWWGGETRHQQTLEAVDLFNETHEGITIEPTYYSYDGLNEKFPVMMVGGTEPDIMQVNYSWVYKFAGDNGDGFYNLNELSDYIDLSNWSEEDLEPFTINGNLMAIPHGYTAYVYMYNSNILDEAGLEVPTTWDELFEQNAKLKETMGDDYYLLGNAALDQATFYMMVSYLTQEYDKEFIVDNQLNFSTEELTEGLEFVQKLIDEGVIPQVGDDADGFDSENSKWIDGHYSGNLTWGSSITKNEANLADDATLVLGDFLSNTEKKMVMKKPSMGFAVSKNSEHPEEAAEFLNWMYTDPEAIEILGTERGVPSNTVAHDQLVADDQLTEQDIAVEDLLATADTVAMSPYYEEPNVRDAYLNAFEKFLYGEVTAEECAEEMSTNVTTALNDVV